MNDSHVIDCGTETVAPLKANVLVLPDPPAETVGKGLIIRPDTVKTRSQRGKVLAIGPDTKGIKVGDRVLFTYWSAIHLDLNGVEHFLYREDEILGILSGEAMTYDQG